MQADYDLVINGGGMVGLALAGLLAESPLRTAVLERDIPPLPPTGNMDVRVSALSLASCQLLRSLGAWKFVEERGLAPFRGMQVWDSEGPGRIEFDSSEIGQTQLGIIAENSVTRRALYDALEERDNVQMLTPSSLVNFRVGSGQVEVDTGNGKILTAKLLVGADGVGSIVRQVAGIEMKSWPFMQKGVVCNIKTEGDHRRIAWQRFLPTGPLAFLPLADPHHCSIVWSLDSDEAEQALSQNDSMFIEQLNKACEQVLGPVLEAGPRSAFDLAYQHANHYIHERVALVGDAAHRIHPLAGQGVNLGFMDAAVLAEILLTTLAEGRDIGSMTCLRDYERARRGQNRLMMGVMDLFKRSFGSRLVPIRQARNLGLNLVNNLSPVKNIIMEMTSGTSGMVPEVMRKPG